MMDSDTLGGRRQMKPIEYRYGVIVATRRAEVHSRKISAMEDNDVLINMKTCNICTTDYMLWAGARRRPLPEAGGHEGAGVVAAIGRNVKGLEVGDHVAIGCPTCGECYYCGRGLNLLLCENTTLPSSKDQPNAPGRREDRGSFGFGEYRVGDKGTFYGVSKNLSFAEAGFLEPVATVIHGMKKVNIKPGEHMLVIGAGTMGLLNAQVGRLYGAQVVVSELLKRKLQVSQELGFLALDRSNSDIETAIKEATGGRGPGVIIVATGAEEAYKDAFQLAPKLSRILIFAAGYPPPKTMASANDIHYNLWSIIGTYAASRVDFMEAAELLSNGYVDTKPLLEASYPLDNIQEAYKEAAAKGKYRVTVKLD